MKEYKAALDDGNKCIELKADWGKGFLRKGNALHGLGELQEALVAYEAGLLVEPGNAQM